MKIFFLFIVLFALSPLFCQGLESELTDSSKLRQYFSSDSFEIQTARIELISPIMLSKLEVQLDGMGIGEFDIDIFGHEGGAKRPFFKKKLIPTQSLLKEKPGKQLVLLDIREPIFLDNDQFFLQLGNFKGEMGLVCDTKQKAECYPSSIESYTSQLILENKKGDISYKEASPVINLFHSNAETKDSIFSKKIIPQEALIISQEHSISWEDVNNDEWMDLLVGNYLWINNSGNFADPISLSQYSRSSIFIDYDNDGDSDILLFGKKGVFLFLNNAGQFQDGKQLKATPFINPKALCVSDINKDKFPDILIAQLWSDYPIPLPNYLFINQNGLDLIDSSSLLYPKHDGNNNFPSNIKMENSQDTLNKRPNENLNKRTRAAQFIDFDQDGDDDLYLVNYFLEEDEFYENSGNGKFTKILSPIDSIIKESKKNKVGYFNHGTGVDWTDFDNDGDFDFIVSQLAHPENILKYDHFGTTLFENIGKTWKNIKNNAGIQYEETHSGSSFVDINNDGLEDLVISSFYDCRYLDVYLQNEEHKFEMKTYESGLNKISAVRDICFVDFNNDGNEDISFIQNGIIQLYENKIKTNNNWLKIRLRGKSTNSYGIGALVKVHCGKAVFTKHLCSGKGASMQSPLILHFGLADHQVIDKIEVYWDKENMQVLSNIKANQLVEITESN